MKRSFVRYSLMVCLLAAAAFAAWGWFRPYAWRPDPAARCKVVETLVTPDHTFHWINIHLKMNPGSTHDLRIPVVLETATGAKQPADTTFAGTDPQNPEEIWFKFWLEPADFAAPLTLKINGGQLSVKALPGTPDIGSSSFRNFTTNQW